MGITLVRDAVKIHVPHCVYLVQNCLKYTKGNRHMLMILHKLEGINLSFIIQNPFSEDYCELCQNNKASLKPDAKWVTAKRCSYLSVWSTKLKSFFLYGEVNPHPLLERPGIHWLKGAGREGGRVGVDTEFFFFILPVMVSLLST